jgi:hypothetical protein
MRSNVRRVFEITGLFVLLQDEPGDHRPGAPGES